MLMSYSNEAENAGNPKQAEEYLGNIASHVGCGMQRVRKLWGGEQLAYIAALAVSSKIIFGDRVKRDTFQRLDNFASLEDLDNAYGIQVRSRLQTFEI